MSFQEKLATFGGDLWIPRKVWSVFPPWPFHPILYGANYNETNGLDYRCFTRFLKPGDFLLCYIAESKFSNSNIKSTVFKHLAVYTGPITGVFNHDTHMFSKVKSTNQLDSKERETKLLQKGIFEKTVTHAVSEGVIVQDFFDFLRHYDKVIAVRPSEDPVIQQQIVDCALDNVGLDYNFEFQPSGDHKALYCTELGEFCLRKVGLPIPEKININVNWRGWLPWNMITKKYTKPVLLADDVAVSFPVVCTTVSCDDKKFWSKSRHADKLRKIIQNSQDATMMF